MTVQSLRQFQETCERLTEEKHDVLQSNRELVSAKEAAQEKFAEYLDTMAVNA